jgi:hypothetical protein
MNKEETLKELRKQFDLTKKRFGFKSTFEEINDISYIEDMALSRGFASNQFSRQRINRMIDTFYGWVGEIYVWIYSQPMEIIHNHPTFSQEIENEY